MACRHFGRCGGCLYLDLPYEQELAIKKDGLVEILGEYGHLLGQVIPSPKPLFYRNKMEFAFGDEGHFGDLALGIRKKRSMYEVATVEECALIPDEFKIVARVAMEYFRGIGEAFYHRKKHTGTLRHLIVRRGEFTGEVLVMLSAASSLTAPLEPLIYELKNACPSMVGFLHTINDGVSDVVKTEDVRVLYGKDYYKERLLGLEFEVAVNAFFQTNSSGAEVLYGTVCDFARETKSNKLAMDLYCGTGTIARFVSPYFEKVVGIDLTPEAIDSAKRMAGDNCEFYAGDVVKIMQSKIFEKPDVVILDPPRDGISPRLIPKLVELGPEKIIYVSCKPTSLARDIPLLIEHGYAPMKIKAIDMFPRTPHVEAVAVFGRL